MEQESKKAVVTALLCNIGIAIFKFAAAFISGSSSMLSEAYHSVSDTLNQVLLLYGLKRGRKEACDLHPFGYGKEQFFWSFVVAVILFGVAGTLSVREGLHKLQHPEMISNLLLNYLAIGVAMIFETVALRVALKNIREEMKREHYHSWLEGVRRSKDPIVLTVLLEDSLALLGLSIAAAANTLTALTGAVVIDAVASIVIGGLLMTFALFLANETRKLLVGEGVTPRNRKRILCVLESFGEIRSVMDLKTMHLSATEVLVAAELKYRDDLVTSQIERLNDRIEDEIRKIFPSAKIYLEAEDKKTSCS